MHDIATIDFAVYEDATEYVGIASVTMPDVNQKVAVINGAGIGGDIEVPIPGHVDAMAMEMAFRNYSSNVAKLREPRRHKLELRPAKQYEDPVRGELVTAEVKHVLVVVPKSVTGGTIAPAAPEDIKISFSVRYLATFENGRKVTEIDPFNRIYMVNGVDYAAPVRKALGK